VRGMYALAATDLFHRIEREAARRPTGVFVSFYEIYFGKLFDLLNERGLLHARENAKQKVVVMGLTEQRVASATELLAVVRQGLQARQTGSTSANCDSSRSHAILQISLKDERIQEGRSPRLLSKLSFVDLAGAERAEENLGMNRQSRMDGAEINKSLLALKECIRAMDQEKEHTPFRGSKLTQVLKESFVGDSRTLMIANLSPASGSSEHCLNTLRYADRVKELRAKPEGGDVLRVLAAKDEKELKELSVPRPLDFKPAPRRRPSSELEKPMWVGVGLGTESDTLPSPERGAWLTQQASPRSPRSLPLAAAPVPPGPWPLSSPPREPPPPELPEDVSMGDLAREHDKLIGQILAEEEELIAAHRGHVDAMVELMKEEYDLVNDVDQPGSTVEDYVEGLERVLAVQLASLEELTLRATGFASHLAVEQQLSEKFNARAGQEGFMPIAAN